MADNIHIIAERQRDDCAIQLIANSGYDRGVVLVRRRSGGVNITEAEVLTLLRRARVKLTEDVRQRLRAGLDVVNADPEPVSRFVVAQGVPAVPGKDAELTWVVEPNRRYEYQHDENDRVDYRRFTDTGTVKEEQLLLKVKPEEPGTPGLNIFGEVVRPRTGKSAGLRRGRNVRVSDDGREYYANVNGRVSFRHGVLSVENVYEAGATSISPRATSTSRAPSSSEATWSPGSR